MSNSFKTITPVDSSIYIQRNYDTEKIDRTIANSIVAQFEWSKLQTSERIKSLKNFINDFLSREKEITDEISWQIGRPISQASSELKGFKE